MPKLSSEEWQAKIQQWQQAGGFEKGHGAMVEDDSLTGQLGSAAYGMGEGALKAVGSFIDPKTKLTEGSRDWYGGLRDWSASTDPEHPASEAVGRFAAEMAPSALTPDLPIMAGANAIKMLGPVLRHPKVVKAIQDVWKGSVGGAEQNWDDPAKGAETGAMTTVGQQALGMVPWGSAARGAGLAGEVLSHGHHFAPWWVLYHLGHPLASMAKRVQSLPPGLPAAAVERARQATDDGSSENQ